MGDGSTILTRRAARHLLARSGFGALPDEVERITGLSRAEAVDELLNFRPDRFHLRGDDLGSVGNSWVRYMIRRRSLRPRVKARLRLRHSRHALQEKLVVFWHDHFASTIGHAPGTAQQNLLFRRHCAGNFRDFIKAINKNPLMMTYLGTVRNLAREPNENYARELMELFTLGPKDFAGNANYEQEDIVQIARAFTGWSIRAEDLSAFLYDLVHDYEASFPARGPKVIFRSRGGFGPGGRAFTEQGEGPAEIDVVTDILFEHRDSDGHNTAARFITQKLFQYFAYANPSADVIDAIVAESGFATSFELRGLLRALFLHDEFYATAGQASEGAPKSVKWPVDYVISTLRLLRVEGETRYQYLTGDTNLAVQIRAAIGAMGQSLLRPPSVFGWDWEEAWLTTGRILARFSFAMGVCLTRGAGRYRLDLSRLVPLELSAPDAIVDALVEHLGIAEDLSAVDRQALIDYLGGPLDLTNPDDRNRKLAGLVNLILVCPAYQVH